MTSGDGGLLLRAARAMLDRAMAKAASFRQAGSFIVVDSSGTPVCAVRMDGSPPGALPLVRAKAFATAANGEPSAQFAARMAKFHPGIFASYQRVFRDQPFPGAGGVPLRKDGRLIGAIATGLGIGPFIKLPGVSPEAFLVDGVPGNLEDLIISYAVGSGYSAQHGDDMARWVEAYGSAPASGLSGTGLAEAPPAGEQPDYDRATALADTVLRSAEDRGVAVSVCVADRFGDPIRLDRMTGCPPMAVDIAIQTAAAAANFQMATSEIHSSFPSEGQLAQLLAAVPFKLLVVPGAAPLRAGGAVAAAVGVAGCAPDLAQRLANDAIETFRE